MYLPEMVNKQKTTIFFSIGLIAGMMVERSIILKVAQVLLFAAAAIIQLRQGSITAKRSISRYRTLAF